MKRWNLDYEEIPESHNQRNDGFIRPSRRTKLWNESWAKRQAMINIQIHWSRVKGWISQRWEALTTRNVDERPKIVYRTDRGIILYFIVQAIPLVIAVSMCAINLAGVWTTFYSGTWGPELQFAAKAVETILQTSLATTLLGFTLPLFLTTDSMPLGALAAPLQINSLSYLVSLDFWASMTATSRSCLQKLVFSAMIVSVLVTAALIGPSGAILLIPRPHKQNYGYGILVAFPKDQAKFTENLGQDFVNTTSIHEIWDYIENFEFSAIDNSYNTYNYTANDLARTIRVDYDSNVYLNGQLYKDGDCARYMVSMSAQGSAVVASIIAENKGSYLENSDMIQLDWWQPWSQVACTTASSYAPNYVDTNKSLLFPDTSAGPIEGFTYGDLLSGIHIHDFYNFTASKYSDQYDHATFMTFIQPLNSSKTRAGLFVNEISDNLYPDDRTPSFCTVEAGWIWRSQVMVGKAPLQAVNPLPLYKPGSREWQAIRSIDISPEFLRNFFSAINQTSPDLLVALMTEQNMPAFALPLTFLLSNSIGPGVNDTIGNSYYHFDNVIWNWPDDGFASFKAGLSPGMLKDSEDYYDTLFTDGRNEQSANVLDYEIMLVNGFDNAFGYFIDSITTWLALSVFLIYCLITLVYLIYTLITRRVVTSWTSIGQMMMLALNSTPPQHLKHSSAGVSRIYTYREPVQIMANKEAGIVELVFRNNGAAIDAIHEPVKANTAY